MDQTTLLRAHVERVLQDAWGVKDLEVDSDGDYRYRYDSAACWVRIRPPIDPDDQPCVEAFALAAKGLKRSAKLLNEINALNAAARWVKIALEGDQIYVNYVLHMAGADREALLNATKAVGGVAADLGPVLSAVYGGDTPFKVKIEEPGEQQ
ncbi:MAG: YbjN domain-containing protein [Cryobacterium sp.]|nr:YbjN domain-containing protein [Cryobacterium sp.]